VLVLTGVAAIGSRASLPSASQAPQRASGAAEAQAKLAADRASGEVDSRFLTGLIGSKHDFSQREPRPRDLCLPCHAPHLPVGRPPALDRGPAATQPFRTYQSLDVELDRGSLLCLSCHDGVVAPEVYTSSHATKLSHQVGASQLGFGGLQGHPVGVAYPTARQDYHAIPVVEAGGLKLPGGRMQCTSCHDPHNTGRHDGMLVISNDRSRLCLTCHRL